MQAVLSACPLWLVLLGALCSLSEGLHLVSLPLCPLFTLCLPSARKCPHYTSDAPCGSVRIFVVPLPSDGLIFARCAFDYHAMSLAGSFFSAAIAARQVTLIDQWPMSRHTHSYKVCGEDCTIQVCPACPEKAHTVGSVVSSTLATALNSGPETTTLSELLITLPECGHVFTVKALDSICAMTDHYIQDDATGMWKGLKTPPSDFLRPPLCPACNSAITSPRYGRVFKRANLDILERSVASGMSRTLNTIRAQMLRLSKQSLLTELKLAAATVAVKKSLASSKRCLQKQTAFLKTVRRSPVPELALDPADSTLHAIFAGEAQAWRSILGGLLSIYSRCVKVADTRSAHRRAGEIPNTYLRHTGTGMDVRGLHAMPVRSARIDTGFPPPRADARFAVEAIWVSVEVRFLLAELTTAWLEALQQRRVKYPAGNQRAWASYIAFVLKSCAIDADLALTTASKSESHRQVTKSTLLKMRVELEQFRFNLEKRSVIGQ